METDELVGGLGRSDPRAASRSQGDARDCRRRRRRLLADVFFFSNFLLLPSLYQSWLAFHHSALNKMAADSDEVAAFKQGLSKWVLSQS